MVLESINNVAEAVSGEAVSEIESEATGFIGNFFTEFASDFVAFFSDIGEIDVENIMDVLKIMGFGMLGIFIVTGIIITFVTLLNKITNAKKKKENQ